ncbi:hypothetical protein [Paraburkholderia sp. D1E]|uniref:hypothetical protein n=1 Tax=Paraburkholderia sp. D1E TaxID=3461398 RepID=UPI004046213B
MTDRSLNSPITGQESMWNTIKSPTTEELALINASPLLVQELNNYQSAIDSGTALPFGRYDLSSVGLQTVASYNGQNVQLQSQFGSQIIGEDANKFVGDLSYELGHFVNYQNDKQVYDALGNLNPNDPNYGSMAGFLGSLEEAESEANNYAVQQQILNTTSKSGNPVLIKLNGDANSDGDLQPKLDGAYASDKASGIDAGQDLSKLTSAASAISGTIPVTAELGQPINFYDYYSENAGPLHDYFYPASTGSATQTGVQGAQFGDPTEISFKYNPDGTLKSATADFSLGQFETVNFSGAAVSSSAIVDQFGNVVSQTVYSHNADGSYVANVYDGQGHATDQDQFHADGSEVAYHFNSNGTQNATVYNAQGTETEYATFGTNGTKTQDVFFDATTGRETQENDFNADGSQVDHIFNANGTQNAAVFNAAGHETEYATFGTNGAKTQDVFFDATTGRETQENDFNADGSQVDHLFNANGTQNTAVFNAAGHETEYATFGTNGAKTQDLFYDATSGRLTQENDFNADGSQVDHLFNTNGTQTAYVFNAAGHETEQATFGVNGAKTQDLFYDATTGRETQENDFNADGSQVDHLFNANGTQTAYVFNATGHETEQATFGTNGKITQDLVYDGATGRELQETDYNTDGSGVAHIFNPDGTQNAAVFDPSGHVSEYATYGTNGKITTDAFYDANGRETQLTEYSGNQTTVHMINADNSQTATVYNSSGDETEYAKFNTSGQKTDDYFFDGSTGRETEYDQYGNNGSMTAHLFNSDNTQNAIIFNGNGQELEYDSFDSSGKLTGFTQFTYGAGGGYNAIAYGPTGYETGWADYGSNNMLVSSGGGQYNFTLGDEYGSGSNYLGFDWGFEQDMGYSTDFGFSF